MPEELDDPTEVAQAVLSVAAAVAHNEARMPGMGTGRAGYDLPDLDLALRRLAETKLMSGPAKAQVFAMVRQTHGRMPALERLAESLVAPKPGRTDLETQGIVNDIFSLTEEQPPVPGQVVFNRGPADLVDPNRQDPRMRELREDVREFVVEFEPVECEASVVSIGKTLALSIETTGYTRRQLDSLVDIVNPLNWPDCPLLNQFFHKMTKLGELSDLARPDRSQPSLPLNNWSGRLREVVDWSFGHGWTMFTTDLDFVFFQRPERAGCTYDLGAPVDHQITVDQGYLLAEDLGTPVDHQITVGQGYLRAEHVGMPDLRRVRTLKQVHFAIGDLDPLFVCCIWSRAIQILTWACIGHTHEPPD